MKNPPMNISPNLSKFRIHAEKSSDSSFVFNMSGSYPVNMKKPLSL